MKRLMAIPILLLAAGALYAQTVEVRATTDKREMEAILRKTREETRINQAYFAETDRCQGLVRERELTKAETSCRTAIELAEKLPADRKLERIAPRRSLAAAMILQQKFDDGIGLLNASIEIGKPAIDDNDSETGQLYFMLGQAHHLKGDVEKAPAFYTKAETIYRAAYEEIPELQDSYARMIVDILRAHLLLLTDNGDSSNAKLVKKRLVEAETEFSKWLEQ